MHGKQASLLTTRPGTIRVHAANEGEASRNKNWDTYIPPRGEASWTLELAVEEVDGVLHEHPLSLVIGDTREHVVDDGL